MYTTQPKKDKNKVSGTIDATCVGRGHQAHRSGAGRHAHRATGRNRTRSQQRSAALRED